MLKITSYIRQTRALSTISRQNQSSVSLILRKYIFTKPGKWPSEHLYLKINSGFHARKNPKQQYRISESSHITFNDASFCKKLQLYLQPCNLYNTLNRPSIEWESFNIRQKKLTRPVCFRGIESHILNLHTVCIKSIHMGEWV